MSGLSSSRDADHPLRKARTQVLATVLRNTGDPQPVSIAVAHLYLTTVAHGSLAHEHVRTARDAALEQELLVAYDDAAGTTRYALTEAGVTTLDAAHAEMPIYGPADEAALREVLDVETSRPEPSKAVIGWANTHLLSLPESGGDSDA